MNTNQDAGQILKDLHEKGFISIDSLIEFADKESAIALLIKPIEFK